MSYISSPIATSTPLNKAPTGLVLKEKQVNAEGHRRHTLNELQPKKTAKSGQQRKSLTKENIVKPHTGPTRSPKLEDEGKLAKRRQQAIEAMKIQEQRRLRMCQQVLADELEQLTVGPATESCDDLIEKKRMEAKKLKEKRILAFIAEQQLQKKKNVEDKCREKETDFSSSFRIKTRRCLYKPRVSGFDTPLPKVPEETVFPELIANRKTNRVIICYTKDEIRSMNPYGYYFL